MSQGSFRIIAVVITLAVVMTVYGIWLISHRNPTPVEPTINIEQQIPADASVILARTGCSPGPCPTYKVTVRADGTVLSEGPIFWLDYQESRDTTPTTTHISRDEVKQLLREFLRIDYFSIKAECGVREFRGIQGPENFKCANCSADQPSTVTAITINRKYKTIEHYDGCEGTETLTNLTDLERKFDEIVNIRQRLDRLSQLNPDRSLKATHRAIERDSLEIARRTVNVAAVARLSRCVARSTVFLFAPPGKFRRSVTPMCLR
jgi:hypothetical protein